MKVALLNNPNNNHYALLRYLRDNGIDAELILIQEEPSHFLPDADTFNEQDFQAVKKVDWAKDKTSYFFSKKKYKAVLDNYDYFISAGYGSIYLAKAGKQLDLFCPYGSDLYYQPFYKSPISRSGKWQIFQYLFSPIHLKVIRNAKNIFFDYTNEKSEVYIDKINFKGTRYKSPFPYLYVNQYYTKAFQEYASNLIAYQKVAEFKKKFKFILFHHCRHNWVSGNDNFSYKANHFIFHAMQKVNEKLGANTFGLVTYDYGNDATASKNLIKELNLESNVLWMPLSNRSEIMACISLADLGIGELGNSWITYGAVLEFLAMKVPILHNRKDEECVHSYPDLYPMYHAENIEDVTKHLFALHENPEAFQQTGEASNNWMMKNLIDGPLQKIINIIKTNAQ